MPYEYNEAQVPVLYSILELLMVNRS